MTPVGRGGRQTQGGDGAPDATDGGPGTGGNGADSTGNPTDGGGGGNFGGGGGGEEEGRSGGGGGGGSGFTPDGSGLSQGGKTGNGRVELRWFVDPGCAPTPPPPGPSPGRKSVRVPVERR